MVLTLPPHRRIKGLLNRKVLPRCGRKKAPSDSVTFFLSLSPSCFWFCITYMFCFHVLSQSSFMHCFVLFNMFLFGYFSVVFYFIFHIKKIEKSEKYKNSMCFVYIGTCVPWITIETKFSKFCIFCSFDEHLYAQLSK